jgi:hypothetical protein
MTYDGNLINSLTDLTDAAQLGVQLPLLERARPKAYRAVTANGSVVACDPCLAALRETEQAVLTGESFPAELCDFCILKNGGTL